MNVLFVTREYPPYGSGIANAVYALRSHMLKKGVTGDVVSRRGADVNITSAFDVIGGSGGLVPFWQKAADYVRKRASDYDVVWLHSPLLINASKLFCVKKLLVSFHSTYYGFYRACTVHSVSHLVPYYYFATKAERHFLNELSKQNNVIVTAVSSSVAEELSKNGLSLFPYVITHGIELKSPIQDRYSSRMLLQQKYSMCFSKNSQILLYIGRVTEVKQPLLLLELFKKVSSFTPNVYLIVVGSGNLLPKLRKNARSVRNVHVLGQIPYEAVSTFLSATDAFISLSCYEGGLPLAVLEAASFQIPLILSDIPTHRLILNSGIGRGILLDSRYPATSDLIKFVDNGLKMQKESNEFHMRGYSWDYVVDQYISLLHNV